MRESLRDRPGVIVYAMTPADFTRGIAARYVRDAPLPRLQLVRLMRNSAPTVLEMAAEGWTGLQLPLAAYRQEFDGHARQWTRPWTWPMREVAAYVYSALAARLRSVAEWLGLSERAQEVTLQPASPYDCGSTRRQNRREYPTWGRINPLVDLAKLRVRTGVPVVVVSWPISHEPPGDSFDPFYTAASVEGYRGWLVAESSRLEIPLIDLSWTLLPRDFLDSRHPRARGRRKIAHALSPHLVPIVRGRAGNGVPAGPH